MRPGEAEERGDEVEGAADYDSDEAEGKQDEPDERVEAEVRRARGASR